MAYVMLAMLWGLRIGFLIVAIRFLIAPFDNKLHLIWTIPVSLFLFYWYVKFTNWGLRKIIGGDEEERRREEGSGS